MIGTRRETKYTHAVRRALRQAGHATNADLAARVRKDFPLVSDTTIHRVTLRFLDDAQISTAPKAGNGAERYDANTAPHDHFLCHGCDTLRDITVPYTVRRILEQSAQGCCLNGSLIIIGDCKQCKEEA